MLYVTCNTLVTIFVLSKTILELIIYKFTAFKSITKKLYFVGQKIYAQTDNKLGHF